MRPIQSLEVRRKDLLTATKVLADWHKGTNTDLLYWYKITNTDAEGGARGGGGAGVCEASVGFV